MSPNAIKTYELTRLFGERLAVDWLTLAVPQVVSYIVTSARSF